MHTTIYRDDRIPVCGRCEGDGVEFHGMGFDGAWASCTACAGTGVAQPPRRNWRGGFENLAILAAIAVGWAILVTVP